MALAALIAAGWNWLGFALPLGLNSVEGGEAALLVGASASRGGWRNRRRRGRPVQQTRGLPQTGSVDRRTQGAMRAERARRQVIDERPEPEAALAGVDPADHVSVERFHREHELEPTGEIDDATRNELQRSEEWLAWIDPTAPESVERFQIEHGLPSTGEITGDRG